MKQAYFFLLLYVMFPVRALQDYAGNSRCSINVKESDLIFSPDSTFIQFTTFHDDIGTVGQNETRRIFTTASSYKSYFGHAAPAPVNFSTDWVVFYSAGTKNTGGYSASITKITTSQSGLTLKITTSLSSPGGNCLVTQSMTKPFVLAKFKHPIPNTYYVQFYMNNTTRVCN